MLRQNLRRLYTLAMLVCHNCSLEGVGNKEVNRD